MLDVLFTIVLSFLAIFLILLILVQRGRGGGLAGALGGMGGSSAFGAKAGDVFTRITIITASIWIALCLIAVFWAKLGGDALSTALPNSAASSPLDTLPGQSGARPPSQTNQPAATSGASRPEAEAPETTTGTTGAAESASSAPGTNDGAAAPTANQ
jgi:preprotein translocase subunit SecG